MLGWAAAKATVAYVVTLTTCSQGVGGMLDGAAVLAHSIRLSSSRNRASGSQYAYSLYVIVPRGSSEADFAAGCRAALEALGYTLLDRALPLAQSEIRGEFLRTHINRNGCCGIAELLKLHAYTIVNHPIVVMLDADVLILQPLDPLFDAMLAPPGSAAAKLARAQIEVEPSSQKSISSEENRIDAFFVRDYTNPLAKPLQRQVGVQGGFLVLRPSHAVYNKYVSVLREGNFNGSGGFSHRTGWGGLSDGVLISDAIREELKQPRGAQLPHLLHAGFYGDMQFQGVVAYMYDHLMPGSAVELNSCVYNLIASPVRYNQSKVRMWALANVSNVASANVSGACKGGREECDDCRYTSLSKVKTAHFTRCGKPWTCPPRYGPTSICPQLHNSWFRVRALLEASWKPICFSWRPTQAQHARQQGRGASSPPRLGNGVEPAFVPRSDLAHGRSWYCKNKSRAGYVPLLIPRAQSSGFRAALAVVSCFFRAAAAAVSAVMTHARARPRKHAERAHPRSHGLTLTHSGAHSHASHRPTSAAETAWQALTNPEDA